MERDELEAMADAYERFAIADAKRGSENIIVARDFARDALAMFALADRLRGAANTQSFQG